MSQFETTDEVPVLSAAADYLAQFFAYGSLPPELQTVARPYADMAAWILTLPRNPERTVALRKLLESRDSAMRAAAGLDSRQQ